MHLSDSVIAFCCLVQIKQKAAGAREKRRKTKGSRQTGAGEERGAGCTVDHLFGGDGGGGQKKRMKINEKRVARPPKAAKLEIHFEGNLICCKWAKNISGRRRSRGSVRRSVRLRLSVWLAAGRRVFVADEDAML